MGANTSSEIAARNVQLAAKAETLLRQLEEAEQRVTEAEQRVTSAETAKNKAKAAAAKKTPRKKRTNSAVARDFGFFLAAKEETEAAEIAKNQAKAAAAAEIAEGARLKAAAEAEGATLKAAAEAEGATLKAAAEAEGATLKAAAEAEGARLKAAAAAEAEAAAQLAADEAAAKVAEGERLKAAAAAEAKTAREAARAELKRAQAATKAARLKAVEEAEAAKAAAEAEATTAARAAKEEAEAEAAAAVEAARAAASAAVAAVEARAEKEQKLEEITLTVAEVAEEAEEAETAKAEAETAKAEAEKQLKRVEQYLSDFYTGEEKRSRLWRWKSKEDINLTDKSFESAFKGIDEIKNVVFTEKNSPEENLKKELEKENFEIKKLYRDIRKRDEKEKELQKKNYQELNKLLYTNKEIKIKNLDVGFKDFIVAALGKPINDINEKKVKNLKEKILESAEKKQDFLTKKFDTSNYEYNDDEDIDVLETYINRTFRNLNDNLFEKIKGLDPTITVPDIRRKLFIKEEKKNQMKIINNPGTSKEELEKAVEELNTLNENEEELKKERQNADKRNEDIQNLKSVSEKLKTTIEQATRARGLDKRDIDFSISSASENIESIYRDIRGAGKEKLDKARGIREEAQKKLDKANKKKDLVEEIKEFQKNDDGSLNKEIERLENITDPTKDGSLNKEIESLENITTSTGDGSINKEIDRLKGELTTEEKNEPTSASLIIRRTKRKEIADKEKELAAEKKELEEKRRELAAEEKKLEEKKTERDEKEAELKAKIDETFEGGDGIKIDSPVDKLKEFDVEGREYTESTGEYRTNIKTAKAIEQSVGLIGEKYIEEFKNLGINEDTNYLRVNEIKEENKILRKDLGIPPEKYKDKYIENVIIQSIKEKESALKEKFTLGDEKANLSNFNNLQIEEIRSNILGEIKKNEEELNKELRKDAIGEKSDSSKLIAQKRELIDNLTKLDEEQAIKEKYIYLQNSNNLDIIKNILTSRDSGDLYEEKGDLSFEDFKNKKRYDPRGWFKDKMPEISEKLGYGKTGIVFTVASIILALLFVTVGGMAAYSLTTLNEEKPYWFYGKTIEGDVTFQKNTSLFLTISFFTFALLLFFLAYINFTKSFGSDFNKSDTSGVGNFFKGLNKNHTYFWRGIFVIFLLATVIYMGCLGVSHVWNGDNYSYFIAMCGGISFFFACYSLGKSKDINFLWELYHGGAKKNLEDEINKWQKNRADPILRKNVFQKLGEYKNQKEEFKELLDKEKGTNKELEEKLKDLPLIESQLKEHERDIKNKEETIVRIKAERDKAINGS